MDEKLDLILTKLESLEVALFFMQEKIDHFEAGYIEPVEIQDNIKNTKNEIHEHINSATAEIKEELVNQTSEISHKIYLYSP